MSRPVTVSCLTAAPLIVDPKVSLDDVTSLEIAHWANRLDAVLPDQPDIVLLPEASDRPDSTFFAPDRQEEYYRRRGSQVRDYLSQRATEAGCYIAYSTELIDQDGRRNVIQIINRTGVVVGEYVKYHPTIPENELGGVRYGTSPIVFELDFGRVGAAICFDLNFEELRLRYAVEKPELMIFGSEYHGSFMQNYWAYSLRSYFAGSIRPPAPSSIISPLGETLKESTNYFPHATQRINLDYAVVHLDENWKKLEAAKRKYGPKLTVHDPGRLGSVLIASESRQFSAADVVSEFNIELLDDYLGRCRRHRAQRLQAGGLQ